MQTIAGGRMNDDRFHVALALFLQGAAELKSSDSPEMVSEFIAFCWRMADQFLEAGKRS
jgi:hypothetical protein